MEFHFTSKLEEYYQKFLELQDKLKKSEEQRFVMEMKFNDMVQVAKEEEQAHYRKLRAQYKRFLEEDKKRQDRNERIIRNLERVETRISMLSAKTERINLLRRQYQNFLLRIATNPSQERKPPTSRIPRERSFIKEKPRAGALFRDDSSLPQKPRETLDAQQTFQHPRVKQALEKDQSNEEKIEILDRYLQSVSSQRCRDLLDQEREAREKLTLDTRQDVLWKSDVPPTNHATAIADDIMNSIYSRYYNRTDELPKNGKFNLENDVRNGIKDDSNTGAKTDDFNCSQVKFDDNIDQLKDDVSVHAEDKVNVQNNVTSNHQSEYKDVKHDINNIVKEVEIIDQNKIIPRTNILETTGSKAPIQTTYTPEHSSKVLKRAPSSEGTAIDKAPDNNTHAESTNETKDLTLIQYNLPPSNAIDQYQQPQNPYSTGYQQYYATDQYNLTNNPPEADYHQENSKEYQSTILQPDSNQQHTFANQNQDGHVRQSYQKDYVNQSDQGDYVNPNNQVGDYVKQNYSENYVNQSDQANLVDPRDQLGYISQNYKEDYVNRSDQDDYVTPSDQGEYVNQNLQDYANHTDQRDYVNSTDEGNNANQHYQGNYVNQSYEGDYANPSGQGENVNQNPQDYDNHTDTGDYVPADKGDNANQNYQGDYVNQRYEGDYANPRSGQGENVNQNPQDYGNHTDQGDYVPTDKGDNANQNYQGNYVNQSYEGDYANPSGQGENINQNYHLNQSDYVNQYHNKPQENVHQNIEPTNVDHGHKQQFLEYDQNSQPLSYQQDLPDQVENPEPTQPNTNQLHAQNDQMRGDYETGQYLQEQYQGNELSNLPIEPYQENHSEIQNGSASIQSAVLGQNQQPYDQNTHQPAIYDQADQLYDQQYDQQYDQTQSKDLTYNPNTQLTGYDQYGQPILYDQHGQVVQPHYDENGQIIPQYDENGQVILLYDQNGQQYVGDQHQQYDEQGQPVQYDATGQPMYGQAYDYPNQEQDGNQGYYVEGQETNNGYQGRAEEKVEELGNVQPINDEKKKIEERDNVQPMKENHEEENMEKHQDNVEREKHDGGGEKKGELKVGNVMDILDTDTESSKQNTSKISNDADFDFS